MKYIKQFIAWILINIFSRKEVLGEIGIDKIVKRKFNFIGSSIQKRGQTLYSYNLITDEVVKVPIIAKDNGDYRGFISPNHIIVWAINYNNAERKLKKYAEQQRNEVVDKSSDSLP